MHRLDPFGAMEEIDEVYLPVSTVVQSTSGKKRKHKQPKLAQYISHKVPICPKIFRLVVGCLCLVLLVVFFVFLRFLFVVVVAVASVLLLVPCPVFWSALVLPTGTGTGGRATATNLGFFPRLGPRAERISRLMAVPWYVPRCLLGLRSHSLRLAICCCLNLGRT